MEILAETRALIKALQAEEGLISSDRRETLELLAERLIAMGPRAQIMFICTHNSRRSQLAEMWFRLFCAVEGLQYQSFSGGTEATAFNHRMAEAIRALGIPLDQLDTSDNPRYRLRGTEQLMFSKVYDDAANPSTDYLAVMVCSDAEKNCPYIPGVERFALKYIDPKHADDTPQETEVYRAKVREVGREMSLLLRRLHNAV